MKIREIGVVRIDFPRAEPRGRPRRSSWAEEAEVANPMSRYPKVKRHRGLWLPKWEQAWCRVKAEDGTSGYAPLTMARVLAPIVEYFASQLAGEDCFATEKLADMMLRLCAPFGAQGLSSYAASAVDLALWDLKGKLLGQPVYRLLGGAQKERIACYATGNDVDWYRELGFRAVKLACPFGPADGLDGIKRNQELVARARETVGDECELMLDCWMAFDVEYSVRLAEALKPYRLRWMEECLMPEDLDAHLELRRRLPWQGLATGEHWYTAVPFLWAVRHRALDVLQPDIAWCGGLTTCRTIAAAADAAGVSVTLHGGGNTPYGQHFSIAAPAAPWLECYIGSPPGVALEGSWSLPGVAVPRDGWLTPSDAPGFGLQLEGEWIKPFG